MVLKGHSLYSIMSPVSNHKTYDATPSNSLSYDSYGYSSSGSSDRPSTSSGYSEDRTNRKSDKVTESSGKIKCVFVGDGAVGKTSLIVSYTTNGYPQEYIPTAFDNYSVVVRVDNQPVRLQLCDTAGQDDFDNLRPLCYPDTDVFLLCFSVVTPASFYNLAKHWVPELKRHANKATPIILVGTQTDLRSNIRVLLELNRYGESPVVESEAQEYAMEIGALQYIECSALTQHNLKEVFDGAILAALKVLGAARKSRVFLQEVRSGGRLKKLREKLRRTNSCSNDRNAIRPVSDSSPALKRKLSIAASPPLCHQDLALESRYLYYHYHGSPVQSQSAVMLRRQLSNTKLNEIARNHKALKQISDFPKAKKGWKKLLCLL